MVGKERQTPPELVLLQQWQETIPLLGSADTEGKATGARAAVRKNILL